MDIKLAIEKFETDPTFFLRSYPKLHKILLKIAKENEPETWIEGMPLWLVPAEILDDAISVGPHGLLFISDDVDQEKWKIIAKHEKLEAELVSEGYSPEEAHKLAKEQII